MIYTCNDTCMYTCNDTCIWFLFCQKFTNEGKELEAKGGSLEKQLVAARKQLKQLKIDLQVKNYTHESNSNNNLVLLNVGPQRTREGNG